MYAWHSYMLWQIDFRVAFSAYTVCSAIFIFCTLLLLDVYWNVSYKSKNTLSHVLGHKYSHLYLPHFLVFRDKPFLTFLIIQAARDSQWYALSF